MGMKKRLRTSEWHQNQVNKEVALRVDAALEKKKAREHKEELEEGEK